MEIRTATESDMPAILNLLKMSLGETLMPKTEAFWRWKHIENPFGRSPVLLAFDDGTLIGVRAFMRWDWRHGDRIYKSVRAVDTATHPSFQGKGVFKKLTMKLVEACKVEGVDFIFNTPNKNSKPGYLKMGWRSNGRLKLSFAPFFSLRIKSKEFESIHSLENYSPLHLTEYENSSKNLVTVVSSRYLQWRYLENPNIRYYGISDSVERPTWLTIFRLKQHRFGTEFRICDTFYSNRVSRTECRKLLTESIIHSRASIVTSAEGCGLLPTLSLPLGPELTTYPIAFNHNFLTSNFWKPSIGDIEVF